MGLVSPGGVHSHTDHLYGLLEMAKRHGLSKVYVHCFLDGRDVPPDSGWEYVQELVAKMNEIGVGKIATVMGRLYAMDRDNAWSASSRLTTPWSLARAFRPPTPCRPSRIPIRWWTRRAST